MRFEIDSQPWWNPARVGVESLLPEEGAPTYDDYFGRAHPESERGLPVHEGLPGAPAAIHLSTTCKCRSCQRSGDVKSVCATRCEKRCVMTDRFPMRCRGG